MNIKEIEISQIEIPKKFYFRLEDNVILAKIQNSINTLGLLRPIHVKECKTVFQCIEGRKILQALKNLGHTKVFCIVHDIGVDGQTTNLILNILNAYPSLAQISFFVRDRVKGIGEEKVSSLLPYSIDEIKRFVQITEFDWSKFQKQMSKTQLTLGDEFNIDGNTIDVPETPVKKEEPKEETIEENKLQEKVIEIIEEIGEEYEESEDKNLVKDEPEPIVDQIEVNTEKTPLEEILKKTNPPPLNITIDELESEGKIMPPPGRVQTEQKPGSGVKDLFS